jgi:putative transcriptional regulator
VVFIESQSFTRRLKHLAGGLADEVLRAMQNDLLQDPERGEIVKGLGGIRKARVANPAGGKGTRGGYRYMHLYLARRDHIHLLFLLDKNEQEDLDEKQRKALRRMVADLKRL